MWEDCCDEDDPIFHTTASVVLVVDGSDLGSGCFVVYSDAQTGGSGHFAETGDGCGALAWGECP